MDTDDEELVLEYLFRIMKALEELVVVVKRWEPQATQGQEKEE